MGQMHPVTSGKKEKKYVYSIFELPTTSDKWNLKMRAPRRSFFEWLLRVAIESYNEKGKKRDRLPTGCLFNTKPIEFG